MPLGKRFVITGHAAAVGGVIKKMGDRVVGKALKAHGTSAVPRTGGEAKSPTDSSASSLVSYAACSSATSATPDTEGVYQIKIFAEVKQFLASQPEPQWRFAAQRMRVDVAATAYPGTFPESRFSVDSVKIVSTKLTFAGKDVIVTWDPSLLSQAVKKRNKYESFSIVRSVKWGGETIPGHILSQEGFCSVHFGEVFRDEYGFNLTLVRLDMGSTTEADVSVCEVRPGGEWMD